MATSGDYLRGHTETIILSALNMEDSYGYQISKLINEKSNGFFKVTETTLYNAFRRLEEDGLISTYWMDGSNGTRRRYYSITEQGKHVLEQSREEWKSVRHYLDELIGGNYD